MFYSCSSLISLPDISKWNIKNINKLNSIFENCSLLTFIPNISKWKFNNRIKINNIFKGCNSLLIIPDISKWNIDNPKVLNIPSSNTDSISIKEIKSDSILSQDIIEPYNLPEDSTSSKSIYERAPENNSSLDSSKNNELDDFYDNFYN